MDDLFAFCLLALLMSMLPGADTVLILKNTFSYGKQAGQLTVLGIAIGLAFWTIVAILGLALVIAQSVVFFSIIKYAGACYLLFLGVKVLKEKDIVSIQPIDSDKDKLGTRKMKRNVFYQGIISNVLNPKTGIFYITFMPQFIDVTSNTHMQLLLLGTLLMIIAVSWFLFVVFLVDYIKQWLQQTKAQKLFQKATGVLLILFGVKVAFE